MSQVYRFRMEPTEMEALELERTASVARYIYNWGLARCRRYYRQHGKSKPWAELSVELTQLKQTELWLYDFDSDFSRLRARKAHRWQEGKPSVSISTNNAHCRQLRNCETPNISVGTHLATSAGPF